MSPLLTAEVCPRLIGVIDLLDGRAVHAIAGNRSQYHPVEFCQGDPQVLQQHYARLGIGKLYIADLNSITRGEIDFETLDAVCSSTEATEVLIDIGWKCEDADKTAAVERLSSRHPATTWIACTESAMSLSALDALAALVGAPRVLLGLDYRSGELIARVSDEADWIEHALQLGCGGAVILDLSSVGTSRGPSTTETCQRVRRLAPEWRIHSGGGIRSTSDVRMLAEAGCDRCLVGTALYGQSANS